MTQPEHELVPIPYRWRSKPWFDDDRLASIPRRPNLFIDPNYVQAICATAMTAGKPVYLKWLSLEKEDPADPFSPDTPVGRQTDHAMVMEIIDYDPIGWVGVTYDGHSQVISMDVITDIGIDLDVHYRPGRKEGDLGDWLPRDAR